MKVLNVSEKPLNFFKNCCLTTRAFNCTEDLKKARVFFIIGFNLNKSIIPVSMVNICLTHHE